MVATMITACLLFFCFPLSLAAVVPIISKQASVNGSSGIAQTIRSTWQAPSDSLTILLLIGGDIVLKALAQLSGSHPFVPIAFSFGWVAFSFNTLMAVAGDGRLMPPPDFSGRVINLSNGFNRDNRSWVLGRLLRDLERPLGDSVGLCITIFEAKDNAAAGVPSIDWCWTSGVVVILFQLGIAAVPWGLHGNWSIFIVTVSGTVLALATGMLPQWRFEKWACRRNTKKNICITGGNSTRSAVIVLGCGRGLDLEDLAAAESPRLRRRGNDPAQGRSNVGGIPEAFWITIASCLLFAALWIVLLITVTSIKQDAWYLIAVGGLGMVQNVVVAGARRGIAASGIHLEKIEAFERQKVMHALMDVEVAYPSLAKNMVEEFFPGKMQPEEDDWWEGRRNAYDGKRKLMPPDVAISEKVIEARQRFKEMLEEKARKSK